MYRRSNHAKTATNSYDLERLCSEMVRKHQVDLCLGWESWIKNIGKFQTKCMQKFTRKRDERQ